MTKASTKPTKRRKPQQSRSKQKVADILAAAQKILEQDGPAAFNTNRVAQEAGIGVGSLYEYFPNKAAIAQGLFDQLDQSESEEMLQVFASFTKSSLHEAIAAIVTAAFHLYQRHSHLYQSLRVVSGDMRRREGIRPAEEIILQAVRAKLEQHKADIQRPDLDFAALMIFYTVEALAFSSTTHHPPRYTKQQWIDESIAVIHGYLGLAKT